MGPNPFELTTLGRDQIEAIHNASFQILREVGVKFPDRDALKLLSDFGVEVDPKTMIAQMSERVVAEALKHVPKKITLSARDPKHDVCLEAGGAVHFGPSGVGLFIFDPETGIRRNSTKEDTIKISRIIDAMPNIHILQVFVTPNDVPVEVSDLHRFEVGLNNSTKHIFHTLGPATGAVGARNMVEMASCVVGSKEELRKRPITSIGQAPASPLQYDVQGLQAIVEYARNSIPVAIVPTVAAGATGPITLAGALALHNAEVLSGITLVQATNPGCPTMYGCFMDFMDLKSGTTMYGCPERSLANSSGASLAKHYGVPSIVGGMNTDAKMPGSIASLEKTFTLLPTVLARPNIVLAGFGALNHANTHSYEQLIIDNEIAGVALRFLRGIEVNAETLATDLVKKVGIGGHYVGERHTLSHVRAEQWFPTLYVRDRKAETDWTPDKIGQADLAVKAKQIIKRILEDHLPEPLSRDVQARLRAIVGNAEKTLAEK
jgi:trimethylamine--corrinoid protein Co-methyltransferase